MKCEKNDGGFTVKEAYDILGKIINDGKGEYKIKIDVNEYYTNLKQIKIVNDSNDYYDGKSVDIS